MRPFCSAGEPSFEEGGERQSSEDPPPISRAPASSRASSRASHPAERCSPRVRVRRGDGAGDDTFTKRESPLALKFLAARSLQNPSLSLPPSLLLPLPLSESFRATGTPVDVPTQLSGPRVLLPIHPPQPRENSPAERSHQRRGGAGAPVCAHAERPKRSELYVSESRWEGGWEGDLRRGGGCRHFERRIYHFWKRF